MSRKLFSNEVAIDLKFPTGRNPETTPKPVSDYYTLNDTISAAQSLFFLIHQSQDAETVFEAYIERKFALEYICLLGQALCQSANEQLDRFENYVNQEEK